MQRTYNPFHSQDNSPYCLLYKSYYINLENLVLDQTTIPLLIFFSLLITCLLDAVIGSILRRDSVLVTVMGVKESKQLYHGLCPLFDTNRNFNFVNLKYTISSISFVAENVSLYSQMYGCSCKLREYKI